MAGMNMKNSDYLNWKIHVKSDIQNEYEQCFFHTGSINISFHTCINDLTLLHLSYATNFLHTIYRI